MTMEEVRRALAARREDLTAMGVRSLAVFGSVARGEAGPESDVDLLVDLDPDLGLLAFVGVKLYLQEALGCTVDLVEADGLKAGVRANVLREAVCCEPALEWK
jgi:predicted nucleotidyltransferase